MNILAPAKAKHLYRLFSYGHGIRESARLAGVNRKTAQTYRADWLRYRAGLQRAYDALCNGAGEEHDAIVANLPDPMVTAMGEAWLDDQFDQPKSGWHEGFEDSGGNTALAEAGDGKMRYYGANATGVRL